MKKTKLTLKRAQIALHKETLRDLGVDDLTHVAGASGLNCGPTGLRCGGTNACTIPTTSSTCPM